MFNKFCSRESSTKWENGQTDQQCLNLFKETKYLLVIDLSFKEGLKTTVWGHVFKPWPPPTPTYVDIKEKKHYFRAFCQFSVLQQCKKPLIWLILLLLLSLLVSVPVLKKRIRIFWKNSDGSAKDNLTVNIDAITVVFGTVICGKTLLPHIVVVILFVRPEICLYNRMRM